jgi:translation initiation factor 2 subunit 3
MNLYSQPNFNLGTLGSVSDGKSTMIYHLTGIKTQKHSSEKHRNITIKPGYANLKIWFCEECNNYESSASDQNEVKCKCCEEPTNLVNHLSFVDCPGHAELILTMMGSVSLMKGAIVVVSAAESVNKKPQLVQHLIASKMANIDKLIICFNKLDLVSKEVAIERKNELDQLLERLDIRPHIIIPTAFNKKLGIQNLLKAMMEVFPPREKDMRDESFFRITRSFDVNKAGTTWSDVNGGIIGGSLIHGQLNIGDEVEIRPGILSKGKDGKFISQPIVTKILSLETDGIQLENLNPGGLVGIGTEIDPYYCKNDMLSGNIMGRIGTLPNVYNEVKLKYKKLDEFEGRWDPKNGDTVFLQIGNVSVESRLAKFNKENFNFSLLKPACIEENAKILVCRKDDGILKIVGFGSM